MKNKTYDRITDRITTLLVVLIFKFFGLVLGAIALLAGFVFLIYTLRNAVAKAGVTERTVRAWEHDKLRPTASQWQVLAGILRLDATFPKG